MVFNVSVDRLKEAMAAFQVGKYASIGIRDNVAYLQTGSRKTCSCEIRLADIRHGTMGLTFSADDLRLFLNSAKGALSVVETDAAQYLATSDALIGTTKRMNEKEDWSFPSSPMTLFAAVDAAALHKAVANAATVIGKGSFGKLSEVAFVGDGRNLDIVGTDGHLMSVYHAPSSTDVKSTICIPAADLRAALKIMKDGGTAQIYTDGWKYARIQTGDVSLYFEYDFTNYVNYRDAFPRYSEKKAFTVGVKQLKSAVGALRGDKKCDNCFIQMTVGGGMAKLRSLSEKDGKERACKDLDACGDGMRPYYFGGGCLSKVAQCLSGLSDEARFEFGGDSPYVTIKTRGSEFLVAPCVLKDEQKVETA